MNRMKLNLMDSLIRIKDDETLEMVIHSMYETLDLEGFDKMDIREFILLSVHKYLVHQNLL